MATNHFGHFLLIQLLLDNLSCSNRPVWLGRSWGVEPPRMVMRVTVTAIFTVTIIIITICFIFTKLDFRLFYPR